MPIYPRSPSRERRRVGALLIAGLLLLGVPVGLGCGGGDEDQGGVGTQAEQSTARSQEPSQAQLSRYLMREDEEPGFRLLGRARTDTGVEAYVKAARLTKADARRLRSEGFIASTFQPIRGPRTYGVTNVALYETAEGAQHSMAHDLRPSVLRAQGVAITPDAFPSRASRGRAAGPGRTSTGFT